MGIVYILTNTAMPGLVKIGRTDGPLEDRMKSLSGATGVPVAFECFYACEVEDSAEVEKNLHDAYVDHRIIPKEFFRIDPERVWSALKLAKGKDVTPTEDVVADEEEKRALQKEQKGERQRRENFNFAMLEIPEGATLTFKDDDSITAEVVDKKKIRYNGKIMTTSDAATQIMDEKGYKVPKNGYAGTLFWQYNDKEYGVETIDVRRSRMEAGE